MRVSDRTISIVHRVRRQNHLTWNQLRRMSDDELLMLDGMGKKGVEYVRAYEQELPPPQSIKMRHRHCCCFYLYGIRKCCVCGEKR